ncbi:MAG: hypothetical protein ACFBZ8_05305 [Opitutales bacterium]
MLPFRSVKLWATQSCLLGCLLGLPLHALANPYREAGFGEYLNQRGLYDFEAFDAVFSALTDGSVPLPEYEDPHGKKMLILALKRADLRLFYNSKKPRDLQVTALLKLGDQVEDLRTRYKGFAGTDPAWHGEFGAVSTYALRVSEATWRSFSNDYMQDSRESFLEFAQMGQTELSALLAGRVLKIADDIATGPFENAGAIANTLDALEKTLFSMREVFTPEELNSLATELETRLTDRSPQVNALVTQIAAEARLSASDIDRMSSRYDLEETFGRVLSGQPVSLRERKGANQSAFKRNRQLHRDLRASEDPEARARIQLEIYEIQIRWAILDAEESGGWPFRSAIMHENHDTMERLLRARYQQKPTPYNAFCLLYPLLFLRIEYVPEANSFQPAPSGAAPRELFASIFSYEYDLDDAEAIYQTAIQHPVFKSYLDRHLRYSVRHMFWNKQRYERKLLGLD